MSVDTEKVVRIGGFSAFWGDTPTSAYQLVMKGGKIDYLIGDYLAEVTMCILAKVKARMQKMNKKSSGAAGEGGYVADFLRGVWIPLMKPIMKRNIKVVTNAGGLNPSALKRAIEEAAVKAKVPVPVVAVVTGDDLVTAADRMRKDGVFTNFSVANDTESLWNAEEKLMSCNAYLGARPIVEALTQGAQIVITGRGVDSALVLGPLMYEFGWKSEQYDLLSAGSLAGHLLECGAHVTGGNFTDWHASYTGNEKSKWSDVGFPIAECFADGSMVITKPDETGGLVTFGTVAEQMVYEIHDPACYALPDVNCDWTQVQITELPLTDSQKQAGKSRSDRVLVQNAKGTPPSKYYKVGATTEHGYMATATLLLSGWEAVKKAEAVAEGILMKCSRMLAARGMDDFGDRKVECIGAETTFGPLSRALSSREVLLRITVTHMNPKALGVFGMEISPAATGMAPGISGIGGGRPRPTPVIKYYSCLVEKDTVPYTVEVGTSYTNTSVHKDARVTIFGGSSSRAHANASSSEVPPSPAVMVPLITLAFGRSGDKGDVVDIGIIAREKKYYDLIKGQVTTDVVRKFLSHYVKGNVERYEMPGPRTLNFVCTRSLGGGGTSALQLDGQGKAYAQKLLFLPIHIPAAWLDDLRKGPQAHLLDDCSYEKFIGSKL